MFGLLKYTMILLAYNKKETWLCFLLIQKINAKNAFGLHLIDYMQDLIKTVKEGDMTNFQVIRQLTFMTAI